MKFTTPINIKPNKTIDHNSRIVMLGSCFAENIGKRLIDCGFNVVVNPMGILYNPKSIAAALDRLITGIEFTEEELFYHNGLWASFMHHGSFSHTDKNEALRMMNERLREGHEQLKNATHLIITFGSAEVYERNGMVVSNCHKLPAREFTHRLLAIKEITTPYSRLSTLNSQFSTLFTISPVRYMGEGAHHGQLNKATLLLATDEICRTTGADYFPSYEIMMDELRDYRFYATDMIHPSEVAVDYIFERFADTYLTDEAIRTADEVRKIKKSLSHRPLHPDSEEYEKFQKKLSQQIDAIAKKYPNIKL
ncbi:MAG: GSCFA domain-containing protein [Paludibacteraceae bacterium]|nr:GSCFA domain-containing protein [Paludibacteraceae bacterium]